MEDDPRVLAEKLPGAGHRLENLARVARAGRVLEADRIERQAGFHHFPQQVEIEGGSMRGSLGSGGHLHHADRELVPQPRLDDAFAGEHQVFRVVQSVEAANRGHAVLLLQLGPEPDDLAGLGVQAYDIDAAREGLKVRLRSGELAELIHHGEGILVRVENGRLKEGASARLEVSDAGLSRRGDHRQVVGREGARAVG